MVRCTRDTAEKYQYRSEVSDSERRLGRNKSQGDKEERYNRDTEEFENALNPNMDDEPPPVVRNR